jgi:hypothetical protein
MMDALTAQRPLADAERQRERQRPPGFETFHAAS